jgi:hypothetical protein
MARIAIDTNVFVHLTNPQENPDSHIDQILSHLAKDNPRLCVDSSNKIPNEYLEKLGPRIGSQDEQGIAIFLLRFWIAQVPREVIETDSQDHLMNRIYRVIPERDEHADRAFVYVSCKGDCPLISNDKTHIIGRRPALWKQTREYRGGATCFKTSLEYVQEFVRGEVS